jgi:hypothetical protein
VPNDIRILRSQNYYCSLNNCDHIISNDAKLAKKFLSNQYKSEKTKKISITHTQAISLDLNGYSDVSFALLTCLFSYVFIFNIKFEYLVDTF